MKKLLILTLLNILTFNIYAQFDINPLPGEEKPEKLLSKREALAGQNNWGEDLLLPDELLLRVKTECKFPVVVKIFDTAEKYDHADLQQGQLPGSNYVTPKGSVVDIQGHSTHVAGIIASKHLGLGRVLVETGVLKFKAVKVLNDQGSGSFDGVKNAVVAEDIENKTYLQNGTFVVCNLSLGGGTAKYPPSEAAFKASKELGVIYCIAAGNTGTLGVNYPGNSEHALGVGSIDQTTLKRSSFSTFGPEVWMGEPGRSINSTYKGQIYASLSGTSMATPFQSALCAIALSKWGKPLSNLDAMKKYMAWVATDITPTGKDNETGYGYAMVKAILDKNPKDAPAIGNPPVNPPTNPPTTTVRNLSFSLNTNYTMGWSIVGSGTAKSKRNVTVENVDMSAVEVLTITKIDLVVIKSNLFAADEYTKVNAELLNFFTNRGLVLEAGSDYANATYWTSYFLDMILKTQRGYDVDVLRIEAKDAKGNTIFYTKEDLKKF